ncbi:MAG: hypothetical protein MK193_14420 [Lentisphaeria bacterium]|nr:hypothetical protein [Lentisphaeria bacterium]
MDQMDPFGMGSYHFAGNNPLVFIDPDGLEWKVSNGHLYWVANTNHYDGSTLRSSKVAYDLGKLENGFSLTQNQLLAVQGKIREIVNNNGSLGWQSNEDLAVSLALAFGFFPEGATNQAGSFTEAMFGRSGVDSTQITQILTAARTNYGIETSQRWVIGSNDLEAIVKYSNEVYAGSEFTRNHPILMRMLGTGVEMAPYVVVPYAQTLGGSAITHTPKYKSTLDTYKNAGNVHKGTSNVQYVRVGRWMSEAEYKAMKVTGRVQSDQAGLHRVANPANPNAYKAAPKGDIYVEYDVPLSSLKPGGTTGWSNIHGPGSPMARIAQKKGLPEPILPQFKNLSEPLKKK